jgi:hypothetical protein
MSVPITADDLYRMDAEAWFRRFGTLKDKTGRELRYPELRCTPVQRKMFEAYRRCRIERRPCLMLVLKPRKDGASTGAQAITYHHLRIFGGRVGAQMGDKIGTSTNLFEMFRAFYDGDRFDWRQGPANPRTNLDDEIALPNGSTYTKETAGSTNAGRSKTPQVANATEVAFFPKGDGGRDPALGFLNSASLEGEESLAVWDTTPNGASGVFYDYWQDKTNSWIKIFVAWFENEEHSTPFAGEAERAAFEKNLTEDDKEERERFGVNLEQLNWRRWCIKNKCQGDVNKFRQEYPSDDVSCWLASGRPRFDLRRVELMIKRAATVKPRTGELIEQDSGGVTFTPDDAGTVRVYEEPRYGCRYLGVADSMTGEDQVASGPTADPDYHAFGIIRAGFIDGANGEWVPARLVCYHRSQVEIEVATNIMAAMARWYGECLTVPEVNNCGLYLTKRLNELGIPVYKRPVGREMQGIDFALGWKTDPQTKKAIVDHLAGVILKWKPEAPSFNCEDLNVLAEMRTFVTFERGQPRAMPGHHDDGVMMLAIGLFNLEAATEHLPRRRPRQRVDEINKRQGWRRL